MARVHKRVIAALVAGCILIVSAFCGCNEADEAKPSNEATTEEPMETASADIPENIDILKDVLEEYFDAVVTGDYEKLISILPPDIVCDDLYEGHISADEYTPELHEAIFAEYREEFIEAREEYATWYGNKLRIDYTVTKREIVTQVGIDDMAQYAEEYGMPEVLWLYADEYYSPIFDMQGVQGIELLTGEVRISGDSEEYGYSESEYTACFIKHSDTWYFVGIGCDLGSGLMWL